MTDGIERDTELERWKDEVLRVQVQAGETAERAEAAEAKLVAIRELVDSPSWINALLSDLIRRILDGPNE